MRGDASVGARAEAAAEVEPRGPPVCDAHGCDRKAAEGPHTPGGWEEHEDDGQFLSAVTRRSHRGEGGEGDRSIAFTVFGWVCLRGVRPCRRAPCSVAFPLNAAGAEEAYGHGGSGITGLARGTKSATTRRWGFHDRWDGE